MNQVIAEPPPTRPEMEQRLIAAERILRIFMPERIGYLLVSIVSCVTLFVVIWRLINAGTAGSTELALMFGSTGLITISSARVIKMFNDVLAAVVQNRAAERTGNDE